MSSEKIINAWYDFIRIAGPYLSILDEDHYYEALAAVEELVKSAQDKPDDPLHIIIEHLTIATIAYENKKNNLDVEGNL